MKRARNLVYAARYNLVSLLSDEDIERPGVADTGVHVARAENYLDLGRLESGVQQATKSERIPMGRILPQNAVSERIWSIILLLLASRTLKPVSRL